MTAPRVIDLTISLCEIPSTTGEEVHVIHYIDEKLRFYGFVTQRQQVGLKQGRDNIFAFFPKSSPSILLTTHLDVVPPYFPPKVSDDGEWLIGRGVVDAKGIAAAMICAAIELKQEGFADIALLFVVGEETSSDGAKAAAKGFVPKMKYVIDGEPTELKLALAMKGAIVFELRVQGKSGHSAYPQSGHSAVHQLNADVHSLLCHAWPSDALLGETTINIGQIEGGIAANVIADVACAKGVMRTTQDARLLEQTMRELIHPETELHILSLSSPITFASIQDFETCVVSFGSDVPHLKSIGEPLLIGPGSIFEAHTSSEKVKIADLYQAVEVYKKLCRSLAGKR